MLRAREIVSRAALCKAWALWRLCPVLKQLAGSSPSLSTVQMRPLCLLLPCNVRRHSAHLIGVVAAHAASAEWAFNEQLARWQRSAETAMALSNIACVRTATLCKRQGLVQALHSWQINCARRCRQDATTQAELMLELTDRVRCCSECQDDSLVTIDLFAGDSKLSWQCEAVVTCSSLCLLPPQWFQREAWRLNAGHQA